MLKLQHDLDSVCTWSLENGLPINPSKFNVITFHRKKSLSVPFQYALHGNGVQTVESISDLGILFNSALSFDLHVEMITAKSLKSLGFIKGAIIFSVFLTTILKKFSMIDIINVIVYIILKT